MDKFLSEAALLGFPKNKSQADAVPEKKKIVMPGGEYILIMVTIHWRHFFIVI